VCDQKRVFVLSVRARTGVCPRTNFPTGRILSRQPLRIESKAFPLLRQLVRRIQGEAIRCGPLFAESTFLQEETEDRTAETKDIRTRYTDSQEIELRPHVFLVGDAIAQLLLIHTVITRNPLQGLEHLLFEEAPGGPRALRRPS